MARLKGDAVDMDAVTEEAQSEGDGLEGGTPKDAVRDSGYGDDKNGIHLAAPRKNWIDEYPERTYADAVTPAQRSLLESVGLLPRKEG